jgi:hypothetical protein
VKVSGADFAFSLKVSTQSLEKGDNPTVVSCNANA